MGVPTAAPDLRYSVRRPCERTELEGMGPQAKEAGTTRSWKRQEGCPGSQVCSNCHGSHRKLTPRIANPLGVRVEKD